MTRSRKEVLAVFAKGKLDSWETLAIRSELERVGKQLTVLTAHIEQANKIAKPDAINATSAAVLHSQCTGLTVAVIKLKVKLNRK